MLCRKVLQFAIIFLNEFRVQAQQHFFKFGMIERPPYFMAKNSTVGNELQFHGSWVQSIEWLSKHLDFTYQITSVNSVPGKLEMLNGSVFWSGASGRLLLRDFDVLGPPVIVTLGRYRAFDYAGTADEDTSALLTPALTEENTILATTKPFQLTVWVMVVISLLSVTGWFAVTCALHWQGGGMRWKLLFVMGDYIFHLVAILTNQSAKFKSANDQFKLSFRLAAAGWCLFALVMVNVYSSTLTSHLTARKMSTPPKDSFEIIEQGVLHYLLIDDGLGREIVLSAMSGPLKKMGDVFRRHPEFIVPDQETAFRKVASGCCAYSDLVSYLDYRMGRDFEETGKCRVHLGAPTRGYSFTGLLLRKASSYRSSMNQGVLDLYQTGLVLYWNKERGFGQIKVCQSLITTKKTKVLHRMNTNDLAGAFLILGVGLVLSLVTFLAEQF